MTGQVDVRSRYGGWALVAGASAGLGAAFAESAAARGLDVVLAARRSALLDHVAKGIERRHGVRTRTVVVDLAAGDAARRLLDATKDIDVGVAVYNAAAEPEGPFLESDAESLRANIAVNCTTPTFLAQGLGTRFHERGRGALAIVSSMAALQGIPLFAAYGAAKAYELILAEGLWYEWRRRGVDALAYVVGATASSTFQGAAPGAYEGEQSTGASRILKPASPEDVADRLFDRFHLGPRQFSHDTDQQHAEAAALLGRAAAVEAMGQVTAGLARFHMS